MQETDIDGLEMLNLAADYISQIPVAYQQYDVEEAEQFCSWEDETQLHSPLVEFNKKATFDGSRDFYISKWSDLSDGHLTFTMTRPTVGVCKSMRIQFDHNWNLRFFLGNVSLLLTYSLNKLLAECLDIPKTKIAYLHHQRPFLEPPLHIWSDAPIAGQYPKIVCKFSLKPPNELPFIYLKVFEADTPLTIPGPLTSFCWILYSSNVIRNTT